MRALTNHDPVQGGAKGVKVVKSARMKDPTGNSLRSVEGSVH